MKELRTIIFAADELELAIGEHQQRGWTHFPAGSIKSMAVGSSPPSVTITVPNGRGGVRPLFIDEKQILSAMVEFCIKRRVPLPIRSAKRVEVVGEDLALVVTLAEKRQVQPDAPGARSSLTYQAGAWA